MNSNPRGPMSCATCSQTFFGEKAYNIHHSFAGIKNLFRVGDAAIDIRCGLFWRSGAPHQPVLRITCSVLRLVRNPTLYGSFLSWLFPRSNCRRYRRERGSRTRVVSTWSLQWLQNPIHVNATNRSLFCQISSSVSLHCKSHAPNTSSFQRTTLEIL